MAKASKSTKKFASSGKLKQTIQKRRQHQAIARKTAGREATKLSKERRGEAGRGTHKDDVLTDDDEDDDDEAEDKRKGKGKKGKGKATLDPNSDSDAPDADLDGASANSDSDSDLGEISDNDDLDDEEDDPEADALAMAQSLKELAKKDPSFYKYLEENDRELLDFGREEKISSKSKSKGKGKESKTKAVAAGTKGKGKAENPEDEDEDEDMDNFDGASSGSEEEEEPDFDGDDDEDEKEPEKTSVTMKMLRGWQRAMIEQRSLRSLRRTILAFRAAAHMNEDAEGGDGERKQKVETRYKVDSALVYNKLVLTALKFTPVVLAKQMPFKEATNGKFKVSPPPASHPTLPRLVLSHFTTLLYLIKSLPSDPTPSEDAEDLPGGESLLYIAVQESGKLLPWVMGLGGSKQIRAYLKVMLSLWSTAADNVRIAAFLAVRRVFTAGDDSVKDLCLKNIYSALLGPLRLTSPHTLPTLNLMKNSAAELYQLLPETSYTHAFGYIRMLASHLRGVVRGGQADQDAFKAVYNWQFVHCIDFWSLVLSGSCDTQKMADNGGQVSALEPLIYPLVQIALGMIRLVPTSRFFPLRFHVIHSLLRLIARTGTYIPLAPFLLEILDSTEFKREKPKASTLKPLDLEYCIRAPAAYQRTRIFQETLSEELVYLLGDFHAQLSRNIAFPELTIPVTVVLRRYLKKGKGSGKVNAQIKTLVEKIEATKVWVEKKRANVSFAPSDRTEVLTFLDGTPISDTPIGGWMRLQKKIRDQKRVEIEEAHREQRSGKNDESESESSDGEEDDVEEMDLSEDE